MLPRRETWCLCRRSAPGESGLASASQRPWRLVVSGHAARRLDKLPEVAAASVIETFAAMAANPRRVGKPLRFELEGLWSAHRASYRIIYEIDQLAHRVIVVAVGHRTDVYRRRSRLPDT